MIILIWVGPSEVILKTIPGILENLWYNSIDSVLVLLTHPGALSRGSTNALSATESKN